MGAQEGLSPPKYDWQDERDLGKEGVNYILVSGVLESCAVGHLQDQSHCRGCSGPPGPIALTPDAPFPASGWPRMGAQFCRCSQGTQTSPKPTSLRVAVSTGLEHVGTSTEHMSFLMKYQDKQARVRGQQPILFLSPSALLTNNY